MAVLSINNKQLDAKGSFAFDRLAEKKYNGADEKGNKLGGFMNIYLGLIAKDTQRLSAFWDCALEHHKENKPSVEDIEDALEKRMDSEGLEPLFKEAFAVIDEAGFYATKRNEFWNGLEKLKTAGKTADEKKTNLQMYETMTEARAALKA